MLSLASSSYKLEFPVELELLDRLLFSGTLRFLFLSSRLYQGLFLSPPFGTVTVSAESKSDVFFEAYFD